MMGWRGLAALPLWLAVWMAASPAYGEAYVVQPGDTLSGIAETAGVDLDTVVALNEIQDPDLIHPGLTLRLRPEPTPRAAPAGISYTVQPGDTLLGIALDRGVGLETLVALNGLPEADFIVAGQVLLLPVPALAPPPSPTATPAPTPTPVPASATATARPAATATVGPSPAPRPTPNLATGPTPAAVPRSVQLALQYVGFPYAYAGADPSGFDCSGFVYFVQERAGRPVPRDIFGQFGAGPHPSGPLQPGDLVFFENTTEPGLSHVGIYLGGGRMVHAIDEERGVGISSLTEEYWLSRWYGATRLG